MTAPLLPLVGEKYRRALLVTVGIAGGYYVGSLLSDDGVMILALFLTAVGYYCLGRLCTLTGAHDRAVAWLRRRL